jgi:hypothetical protein
MTSLQVVQRANYSAPSWFRGSGGVQIKSAQKPQIKSRALELAIPRGATTRQVKALDALRTYGQNTGVDVSVVVLP